MTSSFGLVTQHHSENVSIPPLAFNSREEHSTQRKRGGPLVVLCRNRTGSFGLPAGLRCDPGSVELRVSALAIVTHRHPPLFLSSLL